ncbi:hypothetical protein, partial [Saccharothrix deserti]|uniref:hypothetical protein n=1 Tax=Saccharothrix deserti TaxID=2593674 RepID=UPI001EE3E28B
MAEIRSHFAPSQSNAQLWAADRVKSLCFPAWSRSGLVCTLPGEGGVVAEFRLLGKVAVVVDGCPLDLGP